MGHCCVAKESARTRERELNIIGKHLFSNQKNSYYGFFLIQTLLLFIYHLEYAKTCGIMEWPTFITSPNYIATVALLFTGCTHFEISVPKTKITGQHETLKAPNLTRHGQKHGKPLFKSERVPNFDQRLIQLRHVFLFKIFLFLSNFCSWFKINGKYWMFST